MKTLTFKTNIKCEGCVSKVTPFLDRTAGEHNWNVDTESPDKILRVNNMHVNASQVEAALEEAGYKAEPVN